MMLENVKLHVLNSTLKEFNDGMHFEKVLYKQRVSLWKLVKI